MMSEDRFEIKTGKFGTYFYDKVLKKDVDLEQTLIMLNEWAILEKLGKALGGDLR